MVVHIDNFHNHHKFRGFLPNDPVKIKRASVCRELIQPEIKKLVYVVWVCFKKGKVPNKMTFKREMTEQKNIITLQL